MTIRKHALLGLVLLALLTPGCTLLAKGRPPVDPPMSIQTPRTFLIGNEEAPTDWVAVDPAGTWSVTGYVSEASLDVPSRRLVMTLVARQEFAGVTVFHVLPVTGDGLTRVIEGGEARSLPRGMGDTDETLINRYLDATLSVRDGRLYADTFNMSDRFQEWNGDNNYTEFPPSISRSAELLPADEDVWMALSADPSIESTLEGQIAALGESANDAGVFESGDIDLQVSDRFGGVSFVHVVRLMVTSREKMDQVNRWWDLNDGVSAVTTVTVMDGVVVFGGFR